MLHAYFIDEPENPLNSLFNVITRFDCFVVVGIIVIKF